MGEENHTQSWWVAVLVVVIITLWVKLDNRNERISELEDEFDYCAQQVSYANDAISEAKGYAWSDYEDMGYALDNLEEVSGCY